MRMRTAFVCVASVLLLANCGGKKVVTNPALEPTAVLYPFEPIPVASYEGMGMAQHKDLRIAQEMARTQAMADLGANIFDTVSSRVTDVVMSRNEQTSMLSVVRTLSTSLPLAGKKFLEYRIGQNTGTVYCRVYMAKSEVDEHLMSELASLSESLIAGPVRESLTAQMSGAGAANADVQSLTLFHEQQLTKARSESQNQLANK